MLQGWTLQEWTNQHDVARVDIAGVDLSARCGKGDNAGVDNVGVLKQVRQVEM